MTTENNFDTPQIFVAKGKYADTFYVCHNDTDILKAKALMIRGWAEFDIFYTPDKPSKGKHAEIIDMTKEQVAALPEAFKKEAIRVRRRYAGELENYERSLRINNAVDEILSAKTFEEAAAVRVSVTTQTAIEYVVRAVGQQEYTEWDISYGESLEW